VKQELAREADMLKTVTHPYVIKLLDIFHGDGRLYLVMELVRGGDLFDRIIDKGRYSEELARELVSYYCFNTKYSMLAIFLSCNV
jgi:calcium/calmodulin-dependent protein kinase I